MSKQNTEKRVGGSNRGNGAQGRTPASGARPPQGTPQMADRPAGSKASRAVGAPEKRVTPGGGTGSRPTVRSRQAPPPKGGTIRPLDLALVGLGLLVVGLIVWSTLGNNNTASVQVPTAAPLASGTNAPAGPTATRDPNFPIPLVAGQVAPDFSLPATDGKTYSLSQYKGKVVLLELFAPWCPHCQDDAPIINQVYEKYKDKGVQVLAVSASPWGYKLYEERDAKRTPTPISMDDLIWFRDQFKVPFPILFDKDIKVGEQYGLAFYPTIYIIDKEGKIVSEPAGNFVIENGKPVSQREEAISVDFLSREIEKALK